MKKADQLWVGGLIVSLAKATRLALACLKGSISQGDSEEAMFISGKDKFSNWPYRNIFYAWWPSPKPSNLGEWLSYLSDKTKSSFGKDWEAECIPFVEGYYRVALKEAEAGESEFNNKFQYIFNDGISQIQEGYFDYPYKPTHDEYSSGFVVEKNRVRLSVSIPLAVTTPGKKAVEGWGWQGFVSSAYVFLASGEIKATELVGPVRSPTSQPFIIKHGVTEKTLRQNKVFKNLISAVSREARLNETEIVSRSGCNVLSEKKIRTGESSNGENRTAEDINEDEVIEESMPPGKSREIQTSEEEESASDEMRNTNERSSEERQVPNLVTTNDDKQCAPTTDPDNEELCPDDSPRVDASKATTKERETGSPKRKGGERQGKDAVTTVTSSEKEKGREESDRENSRTKKGVKQRTGAESNAGKDTVRRKHPRADDSKPGLKQRKKAKKKTSSKKS